VILLAYIAFIPTVRSFTPPVSYLTLSDAIVFSNLFGTALLMLETIIIAKLKNNPSDEALYKLTAGLLTASACFLLLPYLLIVFLYLRYILR
jgi:VIT1/CCC1 family predicted Fe2+/Mn2+ transporter